jgi:alanyl-tRNA synthetase
MTKEELEKEADDYVADTNTGVCEIEGIETFICDGEGNAIDADSIAKSAYIAGAEPREKRIEELEKEIKRLETELAITDNDREHNYYECLDLYKKVEELEKENAELKKVAEFQQSSNMSRHFENKKLKEVLAVGSTFNKALNSMNKSLEEKRDKYRNMVFDKNDKLTKAKEIIKSLISTLELIDGEQIYELSDVKEAERFLKEE